jgi:hypothetical protein
MRSLRSCARARARGTRHAAEPLNLIRSEQAIQNLVPGDLPAAYRSACNLLMSDSAGLPQAPYDPVAVKPKDLVIRMCVHESRLAHMLG